MAIHAVGADVRRGPARPGGSVERPDPAMADLRASALRRGHLAAPGVPILIRPGTPAWRYAGPCPIGGPDRRGQTDFEAGRRPEGESRSRRPCKATRSTVAMIARHEDDRTWTESPAPRSPSSDPC